MNQTHSLVQVIVRAMQDKKASRIISLDLSGIDGAICQRFVVCQAESTVQVGAIAAGVEELTIKELNEKPWRVQGTDNCLWVALDYVDVMVHVFQSQMRDYYRLEELWADAPATEYKEQ